MPPSRETLAAIDAVWQDRSIDDDERARRLSLLNGLSAAVNRHDIADVRAWFEDPAAVSSQPATA